MRVVRLSLATTEAGEDRALAHRVFVTTEISGAATNVSLQDDDDNDAVLEDVDPKDWIMDETENGMTGKQEVKSRAVEDSA